METDYRIAELVMRTGAEEFWEPVVPPKVEYTITARGQRAIRIIDEIRNYGLELMQEFGVGEKGTK